jgi:hypothetical protein
MDIADLQQQLECPKVLHLLKMQLVMKYLNQLLLENQIMNYNNNHKQRPHRYNLEIILI